MGVLSKDSQAMTVQITATTPEDGFDICAFSQMPSAMIYV